MSDAYLIGLCQEYVELVDQMRNGQYTHEELYTLDSQRQTTHVELCRYTGLDATEDMYIYAKAVLHAARGSNYQ